MRRGSSSKGEREMGVSVPRREEKGGKSMEKEHKE